MKLALACSAGGHLAEMLQLRSFFQQHPHFFVSFRRPDSESLTKNEKVFFIERPGRNPIVTIQSFCQAWSIIQREKPEVVISTGADAGLLVCLAAKIQGKKVIFIESFCRPFRPSVSGRIAYHFADVFIYQWKALKRFYPKGIFGGSIF